MAKKSKPNVKKSDHKHSYKECLYITSRNGKDMYVHKGTYCTICNKVGDIKFFESVKETAENGRAVYRMKTQDEIIKEYQHLKTFKLSSDYKTIENPEER